MVTADQEFSDSDFEYSPPSTGLICCRIVAIIVSSFEPSCVFHDRGKEQKRKTIASISSIEVGKWNWKIGLVEDENWKSTYLSMTKIGIFYQHGVGSSGKRLDTT